MGKLGLNNKGYAMTEALIVSTVVLTALILIYMQFTKLNSAYGEQYYYNNVNGIYALNQIASYIEDEGDTTLTSSLNTYIDITACDSTYFDNDKYCKILMSSLNVDYILYSINNKNSLYATLKSNNPYDTRLQNFVKTINDTDQLYGCMLVAKFKEGYYASIPYACDGSLLIAGWEFDYSVPEENVSPIQVFTAPKNGTYKIELWGAQGGTMESDNNIGGNGGYSSGEITLTKGSTLYITVGGAGGIDVDVDTIATGGYNGGGYGSYYLNHDIRCAGGGGSTDVRLVSGDIDDFDSLKTRIMVAAGGGGSCNDRTAYITVTESYGGPGGGLNGYDGDADPFDEQDTGEGATQTEGGTGHDNSHYGSFYQGCNSPDETDDRAGGGGGYYGGGCSYSSQAAGGGSSFIAGYTGCNAINPTTSSASNIIHTNSPIFTYNGTNYEFANSVMIDGKGCNWSTGVASNCGANQPQPNGTTAVGHQGNGYAKITYIGE